jgi:Protein of unknown function (DUF3592)
LRAIIGPNFGTIEDMPLPIALGFFYGRTPPPWPVWVIGLVVVIVASTASSWQFWVQRAKGIRGRNWPTVSAVIDLASVQKRVEPGGKGPPIITWVVLLTYVYRNPEMQTGDFDKECYSEDEARAWAESVKGSTVMVHVDPKDPGNSVLRAEDLDAATPVAAKN